MSLPWKTRSHEVLMTVCSKLVGAVLPLNDITETTGLVDPDRS
jgi:hypothetical protein